MRREWRIPGERMKAGREHRVPLSDEAVEVLDLAREVDDVSGLVFPSRKGRELSGTVFAKMMPARGIDATVHGFRSSFRDWCAETGQPREIAEAALAHVVGGTEGAYFRSTCSTGDGRSWPSGARSWPDKRKPPRWLRWAGAEAQSFLIVDSVGCRTTRARCRTYHTPQRATGSLCFHPWRSAGVETNMWYPLQ